MTENSRYDSELLSQLAHDLRTPINSVRGFIEVAIYSGDLSERQRTMLERAMTSLEGIDSLITEVLDMSRMDEGVPLELVDCNLPHILSESVSLLGGAAESQGVTIELTVAEGFPLFPAEPQRIRQVVNNLISNAIKYNQDEGHVFVKADYSDEMVWFSVKDTGMGVSLEDIERIFERGYRASRRGKRIKGNGFGLALVKSIVERHHGEISVESEIEVGSTFLVKLPRHHG